MTGRMIRLGNYAEWSSSLSSNFEGLKVDRLHRTNHSGTFQFKILQEREKGL